jgi:hypothetical protein
MLWSATPETARGGPVVVREKGRGAKKMVDLADETPAPSSQMARGVDAEAERLPSGVGHSWFSPMRTVLVAGMAYLALAVLVWWEVWSKHPTTTITCGCGDGPLFVWFLNWPAYAIAHGLNPLYSTALFHPGGVNLLANTSELAFGVVLAPISWLFGPVASLNVALTFSPVLSALAMFALIRRWASWIPAAFIGGLLYGFSPVVLSALTGNHLMIGMAAVPPLVVICLDELLVKQHRRPIRVGIVLGVLIALQFFISTEVLVMMVLVGAIGVVLVVGYGAVGHPQVLRQRARYAIVGTSAGLGTAVILLAYPAWFALAGPAHFSGAIWKIWNLQAGGTSLGRFFDPTSPSVVRSSLGVTSFGLSHRSGGYVGAILSPQFLGIGMVVVVVVGTALWWRDLSLGLNLRPIH